MHITPVMHRPGWLRCRGICVVWMLTAAPRALGQITLVNAGAAAGLTHTHAPDMFCIPVGQWFMTGGAAVGDFNNDSWPDVFALGGGVNADELFINTGRSEERRLVHKRETRRHAR